MTDRVDIVEFYEDDAGDLRWRRRNGFNHQIIADSAEGYKNRSDCIAEAEQINGHENVEYVTLPQLGSVEVTDDDGSTATD